ncbi:hypothetical protein L596_003460 [Steinernema carpocapsae]|uniref:Uncharacterized protein n=1 Tax=Steinernema carpocapsae TaxID=34508 RepID=A0A4U8USS5_STECR|nr:hypothetical protein L596_003460 [Steinernema carpocapsae]
MSECDVLPPESPLQNGDVEKDEEFVSAEAEVEEDAQLVKKEITIETSGQVNGGTADGMEEESAGANEPQQDEDRTEDQQVVPAGARHHRTENVDPMTTSMDGIEDLPANEEAQVTEGEHKSDLDDVIEVPEPAVEGEEAAPEEPLAEQAEDIAAPSEEVEVKPEEEAPVEGTPAEEPAAAEPEPPADEMTEVPVEEATPTEEEKEPEQPFELQAPPTPKRPRTPNELDNPEPVEEEKVKEPAEVFEETQEAPKTPSAAGCWVGSCHSKNACPRVGARHSQDSEDARR